MNFLVVQNLDKQINDLLAVNNVSFKQQRLQRLAIVGATGSGKTSLLKMIGGLVQLTKGEMYFLDKKIIGPEEQLIPGNKGIAYVSQHFELLNNYIVKDLLQMTSKLSVEEEQKVFEICCINHVLKRKTNELSGGEKQRVALAKQILTAPQLLLLDEPFSNLDALHKQIMKDVIENLIQTFELTCMLVSHDAQDVLQWAERVMVLQDGKIIQDDNTSNVYSKPVSEYAAALLGEYFVFDNTNNVLNDTRYIKQSQLIIRPEQVAVTTADKGLKAVVASKYYNGSYWFVKANFKEQKILLRLPINQKVDVGDEFYFKLN